MSIDPIVNRLIGQGEQGDTAPPLSPAASHELSQRLRDLVGADTAAASAPDRGTAEEAVKLAAYLDGTMEAPERDAYERALVLSPERRDDLLSAAAWLDAVEAKQATPPAELTALALGLHTARAAPAAPRRSGFVAFVERLFPGPRLALATSAIASVAIAAVGLDIALHLSPRFAPTQQVVMAPSTLAGHPQQRAVERPWVDPVARQPDDRPIVYHLPQGQTDIAVTRELADAILAYRQEASTPQRQQLLAALARGGLTADDARRVTTITVNPALFDHFAPGASSPVASVMTRLAADGALAIEAGRMR